MRNLLIILSVLFISCGSRKVEKSVVDLKESSIVDVKDTLSINSNINIRVTDTSSICEMEIKPIDPNKPMVYNGNKVINGSLHIRNTKKGISTSIKKDSVLKQLKISHIGNEKTLLKKGKNIKVDRSSYLWLILLILFIVIGLTYYYYNKHKGS